MRALALTVSVQGVAVVGSGKNVADATGIMLAKPVEQLMTRAKVVLYQVTLVLISSWALPLNGFA